MDDGDGPEGGGPVAAGEAVLRAVLAGFPDRVCRRREARSPRAVMVGGQGVELAETSAVREAELFLALELAGRRGGGPGSGEARVWTASAVEPEWLPRDRVRTTTEVEYDPDRERAVALRRTRYEDLVLEEVEVPVTGDLVDEASRVLAEAAAADPAHALPLEEEPVAGFLARLRSLAGWRPELDLPRFDDAELAELLPTLVAALPGHRRALADLRRAPLLDVLRGLLDHRQRSALEEEAPERLEVPSGNRIRLAYEPGRPPVLAVRIQEMFGATETPRVAGGRVPVLLHLLAPNMRPQQVTDDLASFWRNTYPEVRKELAGRYPKHAWPEDPLAARPRRRPGRG